MQTKLADKSGSFNRFSPIRKPIKHRRSSSSHSRGSISSLRLSSEDSSKDWESISSLFEEPRRYYSRTHSDDDSPNHDEPKDNEFLNTDDLNANNLIITDINAINSAHGDGSVVSKRTKNKLLVPIVDKKKETSAVVINNLSGTDDVFLENGDNEIKTSAEETSCDEKYNIGQPKSDIPSDSSSSPALSVVRATADEGEKLASPTNGDGAEGLDKALMEKSLSDKSLMDKSLADKSLAKKSSPKPPPRNTGRKQLSKKIINSNKDKESSPDRHSVDIHVELANKDDTSNQTSLADFTKEVDPSVAKPPLNFNGGLAKLGSTSSVKSASGSLSGGEEVVAKPAVGVQLTGAEPLTSSPTVRRATDGATGSNSTHSCQSAAINTSNTTAGNSRIESLPSKNTSACQTHTVGNTGPRKTTPDSKEVKVSKRNHDKHCTFENIEGGNISNSMTPSSLGESHMKNTEISDACKQENRECPIESNSHKIGEMPIECMVYCMGLPCAHIDLNTRELNRRPAGMQDGSRREKGSDSQVMLMETSSSSQSCDQCTAAEPTQEPDVTAPPARPYMDGQGGANRCNMFEALNSQYAENIRSHMSDGRHGELQDEVNNTAVYVRRRESEESEGGEHCPLLDNAGSPEKEELFDRLHEQIRRNRENSYSDKSDDVEKKDVPVIPNTHRDQQNDFQNRLNGDDKNGEDSSDTEDVDEECNDAADVDSSDEELSDEGEPLLGAQAQTTLWNEEQVGEKSSDHQDDSGDDSEASSLAATDDHEDHLTSPATSRSRDVSEVGSYKELEPLLGSDTEPTADEEDNDYMLVSSSPRSIRYICKPIPKKSWTIPPAPQNSPQPDCYLSMGAEGSHEGADHNLDLSDMTAVYGAFEGHLSNQGVDQQISYEHLRQLPHQSGSDSVALVVTCSDNDDVASDCDGPQPPMGCLVDGVSSVAASHLAATHLPLPPGPDCQLTAVTPHTTRDSSMEATPSHQRANHQGVLTSPALRMPSVATRVADHHTAPMGNVDSSHWVQGISSPQWHHPHLTGEDASIGLLVEGSSSPPAQVNDFPPTNILDILLGRKSHPSPQHSVSVDSGYDEAAPSKATEAAQKVAASTRTSNNTEQKRASITSERTKSIPETWWGSIRERGISLKSKKSDRDKKSNKSKQIELDPRHSRIPPLETEPPLVIDSTSKKYADYAEDFLSDSDHDYASDEEGNPSSEDEKELNFIDFVSNAFKSRFMNDKGEYKIVNGLRDRPRLLKQQTFAYGDYTPVKSELSSSPVRNVYTTDDIPEPVNPFSRRNNDIFRSLRDFVQRGRGRGKKPIEENSEPRVGIQTDSKSGSVAKTIERGGIIRKHEFRRNNTYHGVIGDQNANTDQKASKSALNSPVRSVLNSPSETQPDAKKSTHSKKGM